MTTALYVAAYALLSTGGVLLLRTALKDLDELSFATVRTLLAEPSFLIGFVLYALSFMTWLLVLRRYEVVTIFPVFVGVGYACVVLGGYFFLGESLSATRVLGILVILAGMALLFR
ncbi:MAG: SMR family transporter [Actinomycetota bacterium]